MGQEGSKGARADSAGSRDRGSVGSADAPRTPQKTAPDADGYDDPGIIVVQQGSTQTTPSRTDAPEIRALQEIPAFMPLLKESLQINWLAGSSSDQSLARLDPVFPTVICGRLQRHLTVCAQLVHREQDVLGEYVNAIEESTATAVTELAETTQRVAKCSAQLQEAAALARQLQQVQAMVHRSLGLMQSLNDMLPESERLETFRWHSPPANRLAQYTP